MAGWEPGLSVLCAKQLGDDNLVPDWDTFKVHPRGEFAYTQKIWEPGEILAMWPYPSAATGKGREYAKNNFPSEIWVWTPGGRVPVDLRHCTWDGQ